MYNRNITVYMYPGSEIWKQEMLKLPFPFPELAEKSYITSSNDEFYNMTKINVLEKESFFYQLVSRIKFTQ